MKTKSELKKKIQQQNELISTLEVHCKKSDNYLSAHRRAVEDLYHLVEGANRLFSTPETKLLHDAAFEIYNSVTLPF